MNLTTAGANRTHIAFFGTMNAGKSSLINAFTGQDVSIVSPVGGTTADSVRKPMEINGIGACTLIDTAGFDDEGDVGALRAKRAARAKDLADLAVVLFAGSYEKEKEWVESLLKDNIPVIGVLSKADLYSPSETETKLRQIENLSIPAVAVSSTSGQGIDTLRAMLVEMYKDHHETRTITGSLVEDGGTVLLVMPQDPQAPTGRLIQPQVQTIRELLDRGCIITSCSKEGVAAALENMKKKPDLIITDSQCFFDVYALKPAESRLTSFSILFAAFKGDIRYYTDSVRVIKDLNASSKVLIAEVCTHAPMEEDIGRVKIPNMLRKKCGNLTVDICAGSDFPADLNTYDLIIQCGGCMFHRRHIMARTLKAKQAGVPMTNYGIVIAYLQGILDHVELPV